jgi:hypothetical protein
MLPRPKHRLLYEVLRPLAVPPVQAGRVRQQRIAMLGVQGAKYLIAHAGQPPAGVFASAYDVAAASFRCPVVQ